MNTVLENIVCTNETEKRADGTLNLNEIARKLLEDCLNTVMSEQADELCGEGNRRNGYRERKLNTCIGQITLRIPKLREGSYFPDEILKPYSRTDWAMAGVIAETYKLGLSQRKIERAAAKMGFGEISSSAISRMCARLDDEVDDLRTSAVDGPCPYLWLDATYIKCRDEGRVKSMAIVTAIALRQDSSKAFVGVECVDTESYESWKEFLLDLRKRGVRDVKMIVSDDHSGLVKAAGEVWSEITWQRCIVHLERNVIGRFHNKHDKQIATRAMKAIFKERDPHLVKEMYRQAIERISAINRRAAELLEDAQDDALAYLDFPHEHHIRLRTNNVQERANREIKRRSDAVQTFPSKASLIRLVGSVCVDLNDEWAFKNFMNIRTRERWGVKTVVEGEASPEIIRRATLLLDEAFGVAA